MNEKALTTKENNVVEVQQSSPLSIMQQAIQGGMDLDKLDKMMELQAKWEAQQAKKAYVAAMAAFKADPPEITKDRHVSYATTKGKTDYRHASLANVTKTINAALSKHGLSASWETNQESGLITVTCAITHDLGHSESTSLSARPDESGSKNPIQAIGSTVTYLQRYTLLALTGLATHDQDDDAAVGSAKLTPDQVKEVRGKLGQLPKTKEKPFLKTFKVEKVEDILQADYSRAIDMIQERIDAQKGE